MNHIGSLKGPLTKYFQVDNGRAVIDADLYHSQDIDEDIVLEPLLSLSSTFDKTITKSLEDPFGDLSYLPPPPPDPFNFMPGFSGHRKKKKDKDGKDQSGELKSEHYRFCDAMVKGYCLTSKQWGTFRPVLQTGYDADFQQ